MLKLLGAIFVMTASVGYAMVLLERKRTRLRILQSLIHMIGLLADEIRYERLCLGEIFRKLNARYPGPAGMVMSIVADRLDRLDDADAGQIWKEVIQKNRENLQLTREDLDILTDAGQTLGYLDTTAQIVPLEHCVHRLQMIHDREEQDLQRKKKLFFYLGMSCGIFVILILV